ncbi:MAG: cupredoxin domain-containing protein [Candidatus Hydrothermarchaeaceae archaeon]
MKEMTSVDKTEGAALVIVLLAVFGTMALIYYYEFEYRPAHTDEILITGVIFEDGGWEPSKITVKKGDTVKLKILSNDVTHGLIIPQFNVNTGPIQVGKVKTVEFTADKAGSFIFYCSVLCSGEHHLMKGTLIVEDVK